MIVMRRLGALLWLDARNVRRDPMLRWMVLLPVVVAILMRWGIPALDRILVERLGRTLVPYYPLIASFCLFLMPGLVGMVIGFLLLDQRDDGTLTALRVTPLPFAAYLTYLLVVPMLLSSVTGVLLIELTGLVRLPLPALLGAAVAAAPIAPLYALFLARFAGNKVEGFALAKAVGVVQIPLVLAWWVHEPWQWLFGVVPYYWPAKAVWASSAGCPVTIYVLLALLFQTVLAWSLLRRAPRWLPAC